MMLSVTLAIPIPGLRSAALCAWTLVFRLKARGVLHRRKITMQEYRTAQCIHSIPVMLLALLPGFGTAAYATSNTVTRKGLAGLLLNQTACRPSFVLYQRLHLARITASRPRSHRAECPFCHTLMSSNLQSVQIRY